MLKLSLILVLVEAVGYSAVQVAADYFAVQAVVELVAIAADYYSAVQVVGYSEQAAVADYYSIEQVVAVGYSAVDYYFLQST